MFNHIPLEICDCILKFLQCKHKLNFYITNRIYNSINYCSVETFSTISICKKHNIKELNQIQEVLDNFSKYSRGMQLCNTIHFKNKRLATLALPRVRKLGRISHRCCEGRGFVFLP